MATKVRYIIIFYGKIIIAELATIFHCLVQDEFRETALVTAVNSGHLHIAEILVKNGADVNYRNKVIIYRPNDNW